MMVPTMPVFFEEDGDTATVRGVVCFGEEEFLLDGFVLFFEKQAPVEGAVAGEVDEVDFALDPSVGCLVALPGRAE